MIASNEYIPQYNLLLDKDAGLAFPDKSENAQLDSQPRGERMTMLEWAGLGAIMLGIMIFCARVMRRGLRTLDDDRQHFRERLLAEEKRLKEDRQNISSREHLAVARAAIEDLLRLDGNPPGHEVRVHDKHLELVTPKGIWRVELMLAEHALRSTKKIVRGRGRWLLSGFGHYEQHQDTASLLRGLNEHLHAVDGDTPQPEHLARRLRGLKVAHHQM